MTTATLAAVRPPESPVIHGCLRRVRRRLWLTRLRERAALAIAIASTVALGLSASRLVWDRFLWLAIAIALLPLVAGVAFFIKQNDAPRRVDAVPPPPPARAFLRLTAVLAVILPLVFIGALFIVPALRISSWSIPAVTVGVYLLAAIATLRPIDAKAAAIFVDQQAGLEERVATALELLDGAPALPLSPAESAFREPVIAAAVEACAAMRWATVGYARADSRLYALAATAAIAAGVVCFLTPLPAAAPTSRQPYLAVIDKSQKLENLLNELEQKKIPESAVAEKKIQPLKNALAELRKGNMSPFEADERLAQEKSDLQKEQDKMDAAEKVEKALEEIKGLDEVAKAGDQLKEAHLHNGNGSAGAAASQREAERGMKDAANAVGDKMKNGGMSAGEKDQLAAGLQKAGEDAKGDPQLQQNLQRAAAAAKKGDGDALSQSLAAAGSRMGEQGAQQQLSGDAVRQAMEAIDQANRDSHGDASSAQAGGNSPASSPGSEQQGGGPSQQANSGQQSGGQQNGGSGQKGGGQQQAGGQQPGSGQQQSSQMAGGGGQHTGSGGSTNLHAPSGPGDHNAGHPLGGTGDYVKVYDEKAIASQGKIEHASGKINPLGAASGTEQILGQADATDSSIQTYESQLPAAKKRALDDLQTQQIPPQYRDLIRNYYGQ